MICQDLFDNFMINFVENKDPTRINKIKQYTVAQKIFFSCCFLYIITLINFFINCL